VTRILAAGGLLSQHDGDRVLVAIVHRRKQDDWSLPKGKLHRGEHPLLGGCREVTEETGYTPVVGARLPTQEYAVPEGRKQVDFWAMRAASGSFTPNNEVDELRWLDVETSAGELSYDTDRAVLQAFVGLPVVTTVLLVRHAKAGDKRSWHGDDRLRPLDAAGQRQAQQLRRALALWAPARVGSADRVRCEQTIAPLAADLGLPVESEPALAEEATAADPAAAVARIRALAAGTDNAVVCSQGGAIPTMVEILAESDGVRLDDIPAKKGSTWALHFAGQRLVAADYYADFDPGK